MGIRPEPRFRAAEGRAHLPRPVRARGRHVHMAQRPQHPGRHRTGRTRRAQGVEGPAGQGIDRAGRPTPRGTRQERRHGATRPQVEGLGSAAEHAGGGIQRRRTRRGRQGTPARGGTRTQGARTWTQARETAGQYHGNRFGKPFHDVRNRGVHLMHPSKRGPEQDRGVHHMHLSKR